MGEGFQWAVCYEWQDNRLRISLLGPARDITLGRETRFNCRDVLAQAEVSVDAPEILLDKEVERVKAELLERHRTVTALVEKHNGKGVA